MRKARGTGAWGRDEGIFRRHPTVSHWTTCALCGRELAAHALSRAAHAKRHVRDGEAIPRTEYGNDGPRTIWERVNKPAEVTRG